MEPALLLVCSPIQLSGYGKGSGRLASPGGTVEQQVGQLWQGKRGGKGELPRCMPAIDKLV